ncbi:hypothetical protein FA95DRAFT_885409 [Auriscalpium vulgare]|uniref:Uncharacterized protein n=1 Tax=Auriscalpium vulgare TaxID=40419 RepID=A0ACB8R8Y4_9AGAM|nr:hypothetical protein FA95DRAFT_885409 [Auriscalpium vulgare]
MPVDLTPTSNLNAAQASLPGWPNGRLHRRFSNGLLAVEPHHAQLNRITRATLLSAAPAPAPSEKPHKPAQASEQKATFICYAAPSQIQDGRASRRSIVVACEASGCDRSVFCFSQPCLGSPSSRQRRDFNYQITPVRFRSGTCLGSPSSRQRRDFNYQITPVRFRSAAAAFKNQSTTRCGRPAGTAAGGAVHA